MHEIVPESVEIVGDDGRALRGIRWGAAPARCLLLHDLGADLDEWDVIPAALAAAGMSAIAIDLPGHGLSDDGPVPEVGEILARCGGLVASKPMILAIGAEAAAVLREGADLQLAGMIGFGPAVENIDALPRSSFMPKLLIGRTGVEDEVRRCRQLSNHCGGWAIASSVPGDAPFSEVFASRFGGMVCDQVVAFSHDCLGRVPLD